MEMRPSSHRTRSIALSTSSSRRAVCSVMVASGHRASAPCTEFGATIGELSSLPGNAWTGSAESPDTLERPGAPIPQRRGREVPMGVFERMAEHGHEQVVFCYDRTTGMKAIIAIHDTTLGPARGGTRFKAYQSEDEALEDVLRLSSGMTYKFAYTDMPRGGGKAVVLDDPSVPTDKPTLLRVFGRFVQLLAGRFGTGPDLGTSSRDMVHLAAETDYVWALDETHGGTGDSTPLTAEGVLAGIQVALGHVTGTPELDGRCVAVPSWSAPTPTPPGPRRSPASWASPWRTRSGCSTSNATCSAPTPSAGSSTSTPSRGCTAGSSRAAPTTSSPRRRTAAGCSSGGSSTRPTT